jgi:hypothetical protein
VTRRKAYERAILRRARLLFAISKYQAEHGCAADSTLDRQFRRYDSAKAESEHHSALRRCSNV